MENTKHTCAQPQFGYPHGKSFDCQACLSGSKQMGSKQMVKDDRTMYKPTMHKEIPMGTRVVVPAGYCSKDELHGTVSGISFIHVIFGYIVILDQEIDTEYGKQKAISIPGPQLNGEDGTNWRL